MKYLYFLPLILTFLSGCKKNESVYDPVAIAGDWRLTSIQENATDGKTEWRELTESNQILRFRYDGVMLTEDGLGYCCSPGSYLINGVKVDVVPKEPVPVNPMCAYVFCIACDSWTIEQNGDELIVELCNGAPARYRYLKVE